jgi:hypothetical protein
MTGLDVAALVVAGYFIGVVTERLNPGGGMIGRIWPKRPETKR